ncbi:MAG TPA: adenylate kinase [Phycisphaerae bacterium]|nr:adenylate kinase [Phycisphaerae bacterium]
MRLVLLGPPGAGKGTQAKLLAERFGLAHLSSGDILRAERAAATELGEKAQGYMDAGQLVPDDLIVSMMAQHMARAERERDGYVLDGFPRTHEQARALDRQLSEQGSRLDAVLELKVDDDVAVRRLAGRRGKESRTDDAPEVVRQRLRTYHEQTAPISAYYAEQGLLKEVDGGGEIEGIHNRLAEIGQAFVGSRG